MVGGLYPALAAAVFGFVLLEYYFAPPIHSLAVDDPETIFALIAYLVVAVAVSAIVDTAARRTREAGRARAEAAVLATLSGSVLRGEDSAEEILNRLRHTYCSIG